MNSFVKWRFFVQLLLLSCFSKAGIESDNELNTIEILSSGKSIHGNSTWNHAPSSQVKVRNTSKTTDWTTQQEWFPYCIPPRFDNNSCVLRIQRYVSTLSQCKHAERVLRCLRHILNFARWWVSYLECPKRWGKRVDKPAFWTMFLGGRWNRWWICLPLILQLECLFGERQLSGIFTETTSSRCWASGNVTHLHHAKMNKKDGLCWVKV